jgi:Protein of unknown function (DUF1415)
MTEAEAREVVSATKHWLVQAVIGLDLCPFARAVHAEVAAERYEPSFARVSSIRPYTRATRMLSLHFIGRSEFPSQTRALPTRFFWPQRRRRSSKTPPWCIPVNPLHLPVRRP